MFPSKNNFSSGQLRRKIINNVGFIEQGTQIVFITIISKMKDLEC